MMPAGSPLFDGLGETALGDILGRMRPLRFNARAVICREGEAGESLFVIQRGLAQVLVNWPDSPRSIARLRPGEVVGEMSLVTGEPRSATIVANVPTDVLELQRPAFAALLARYPTLLANLNRILSLRLAERNVQQARKRRGEAVALLVGPAGIRLLPGMVTATEAASPRSVISLDLTVSLPALAKPLTEPTVAGVLAALDGLLAHHGTVLVTAELGNEDLPLLLEHMDRVVVLATNAEARRAAPASDDRTDLILFGAAESSPPRVTKRFGAEPTAREIAWLGRHLTRTKLGLALGAGGAKGYAHVGALHILEKAGYSIDYVAGSSIGAMVGAWLGLGKTAAEIEAIMRRSFAPDNVAAMFKLSMAGTSSGLDVHTRVCQETTENRTFADLQIPLVAMAVDLNTRQPAPIQEGPVWQALLASTALAGMFPPYQRGSQRLVDGLALVPVPTDAVRAAGADIAVSVNIMSRDTLPAWPGMDTPPPPPPKAGSRMLETLLEVMDLAQLDSSIRHAALADVVITPRFGPHTWRDFHLADLFLAAGRKAAEEQLQFLRTLARPQSVSLFHSGGLHGSAVHVQ
jgi:predicted acylesterase/phospholipase RssA/CRP-like cAMP-binding protein